MKAAPRTMSATPLQRTASTRSCRRNCAASVVMMKLTAVRGQTKLTSRWPSRYCSWMKKIVSSSRPDSTFLLVNQLPTRVRTFFQTGRVALRSVYLSEISLMPFFRAMTPKASKAKAMRRMIRNFAISQILVMYQFDAEFFDQLLHARADEGVQFVLKFIEGR